MLYLVVGEDFDRWRSSLEEPRAGRV
jgi:hypothetical protein